MELDLRALLLSQAPLVALVGQRVYRGRIPQGAASPLLVLYGQEPVRTYHMQGPDALTDTRVQIEARSLIGQDGIDAMTQAETVKGLAVAFLNGYRGTVGGTYFSMIRIAGGQPPRQDATGSQNFQTLSFDALIWSRPTS